MLCRASLCALFFPPLYPFADFVFLCLHVIFLSSIPVLFLVLPFVSLVSFLFFSCLVLLFCALTSGPPGVSPVTASSSVEHPTFFSSALAAYSSTSFGFFTSCFRFLGLFSSWWGFAAVWYCRRGACYRILPVYSFARSSSPDYFVEGFPEWHFDAQWSPDLANSL